MTKPTLKDFTETALADELKAMGEAAFRAKQLRSWLWAPHFAADYAEMTNLPAALRAKLAERISPFALKVLQRLKAEDDGTVKWLSELADGNTIETVLIRVPKRTTVCISTQVGCAVRCVFCASGRRGLVRNLTPAEIMDQVLLACREVGERVDNIVVMGMGEPLMNLDNLITALDTLASEQTLGLGARHVTISTSGIVPGIRQLAQSRRAWNLAFSLHAVDEAGRAKIIPGENRYPLPEIFEALEYHRQLTGRMLTLEYTLIAGSNDADATLVKLAQIAHRLRAKVNLIPCNPAGSNCAAPPISRCQAALSRLIGLGVQATLRLSHGASILAACGQLRSAAAASVPVSSP